MKVAYCVCGKELPLDKRYNCSSCGYQRAKKTWKIPTVSCRCQAINIYGVRCHRYQAVGGYCQCHHRLKVLGEKRVTVSWQE